MLRSMLSEMRSGEAAAGDSSNRSGGDDQEPIVRAPDAQQRGVSLIEDDADIEMLNDRLMRRQQRASQMRRQRREDDQTREQERQ